MTVFSGTRFYTSAACVDQLPLREEYHEIAFIGRSNAGKSRAINVLVGQKKLAFMSKKPGKTRLINFFEVPQHKLFLVDLPGYGYAAVSRHIKESWDEMLTSYIQYRSPLRGVVLLTDSRRPLNEYDLAFLDWFRFTSKPVHLVLTKSDQLNNGEQRQVLKSVEARVRDAGMGISSIQLMSSLKRVGIDELSRVLLSWLV